jgi:two-component system sensor histidine kinase HydH
VYERSSRMRSRFLVLRSTARLAVGRRFLSLRPFIALVGGLTNAFMLKLSFAETHQKAAIAICFGTALVAFFTEAWLLRRYPLTERWLFGSLMATLIAIALGSLVSGGTLSPFLPLIFAPVVVGFAAFGRSRETLWLLGMGVVMTAALAALPNFAGLQGVPAPWGPRMVGVSACMALMLLVTGVVGLVDAHASAAASLEVMRNEAVLEMERHTRNMDLLNARLAHEVKNPLTAIRGLVQLIARKTSDERDRERLAVVQAEVDRALDMLRLQITMAKPLGELERTTINTKALLRGVIELLHGRAADLGIELAVDGDDEPLFADEPKLRSALVNLVLNSLAASGTGSRVLLSSRKTEAGTQITVADEGRGMTKLELAHVGEPFITNTEGGTGLGVSIARSISEQHGGKLTFISEQGVGTTVTIEIPTWQSC